MHSGHSMCVVHCLFIYYVQLSILGNMHHDPSPCLRRNAGNIAGKTAWGVSGQNALTQQTVLK